MIDDKTPERINELGETIATAAEEMERIFRELLEQADNQLAAAAAAFLAEHEDRKPLMASYIDKREALLKAAVAAGNLMEMSGRATKLRSRATPWRGFADGGQFGRDIAQVCEAVGPEA